MEINLNEIMDDIENTKLNKIKNDIYLSNNDINVLKRYNINYLSFNNTESLIFEIEQILNEGLGDDDLERLSESLQELNYYKNTNK